MRRFLIGILSLSVLLFGFERVLCTPPDQKALHEAIHRSADYLEQAVLETGQFRYLINLNPKIRVPETYNVLRHAGALYAMALYEEWAHNQKLGEEIKRSVDYFRITFIGPVEGIADVDAVWSPPEITNRYPLQAKLGGTGLGLVALTAIEKILPGTTSEEELRRLGRFLLYMQKEDGSFYSKFIPRQGGRSDRWISLYYPGEAALGLALLFELDPDPQWLEGARRALLYLARIRAGRGSHVEADHWALLATRQLLQIGSLDSEDRERLISHAKQICRKILSERHRSPINPFHSGSIGRSGDTTPTATRLEGLLAALDFLPPTEAALRESIVKAIRSGIPFLLRGQVKTGKHAGAVIQTVSPFPFIKVGRRSQEVRIDYVQHAMSALMQYDRYFYPESSP